MESKTNKVMSLAQAIEKYVMDGAHLSIGGFTINRNPMAAVHEIIRQRIKHLHLYAHSNGQGLDELIGAGCVDRVEIAYGGTGRFAPTCIRFKQAVQNNQIEVEDYSNYQMTLRFLAGSMGVPFLPTRSGLGTDIVNQWGFSQKLRRDNPKMPNEKVCVIDNPFGSWGNAPKVVLVPAINPDITIVHTQKADCEGTLRIEGLTFADIEQVKAAHRVIATCEEIVGREELRKNSDSNQVPFFCVDAVVLVPMGAYPTACYRHYDYDPVFLNDYRRKAGNEQDFQRYLDRYVYQVSDHREMLALIPENQLRSIRADTATGYATGLIRD